jgi:hypothetical protein
MRTANDVALGGAFDERLRPFVNALAALLVADLRRHPPRRGEE